MAGFKPETAESGSQVAQKIKDLLESPNPPFRLQTNTHPIYAEIPKSKFVDPTGSAAIDLAYKRFFAWTQQLVPLKVNSAEKLIKKVIDLW